MLAPLIAALACVPQSTTSAKSPEQDKGMEKFANDKDFHKAHTHREPDKVKLEGKNIEFVVGEGKGKAYWVAPKAGQTQSLLMIHEWWGLTDNIRQTADMVRDKAGYGVLAIDLYKGQVAKSADEAGKLMGQVDERLSATTINAALRLLQSGVDGGKGATKIGTIGFCFGGGWSHKAAVMGGDKVQACVVFYGMPVTAPGELERLQAPVYFVWPNQDRWINKDVVEGFKSAMESAGKALEVEEFEADHAFANPTSKSFNDGESQRAWSHTLKFLKEHLE
jgi:carboxymethylenebutenolidase